MSNYPHGSASSLGDSRRSKINILNGEKIQPPGLLIQCLVGWSKGPIIKWINFEEKRSRRNSLSDWILFCWCRKESFVREAPCIRAGWVYRGHDMRSLSSTRYDAAISRLS